MNNDCCPLTPAALDELSDSMAVEYPFRSRSWAGTSYQAVADQLQNNLFPELRKTLSRIVGSQLGSTTLRRVALGLGTQVVGNRMNDGKRDRDWELLTAKQFLAGYDEGDAVYDEA